MHEELADVRGEVISVVLLPIGEDLPHLGSPKELLLSGEKEVEHALVKGEPCANEGVIEERFVDEGVTTALMNDDVLCDQSRRVVVETSGKEGRLWDSEPLRIAHLRGEPLDDSIEARLPR